MKSSFLVTVVPVLALAAVAEAREQTSNFPHLRTSASAMDARPFGTDARTQVHPLVFDAGDACSALAQSFEKRRQGKVKFALRGAGIDRDIAADCDVTANRSSAYDGMPEPPPAAITCRFHEAGRALPARLMLLEERSRNGSEGFSSLRRGKLRIDGLEVQIAERGKAKRAQEGPGEYLFSIDNVTVGSVELAGRPSVRYVISKDRRVKRAVMLGATAIGVLWSPQGSELASLADRVSAR